MYIYVITRYEDIWRWIAIWIHCATAIYCGSKYASSRQSCYIIIQDPLRPRVESTWKRLISIRKAMRSYHDGRSQQSIAKHAWLLLSSWSSSPCAFSNHSSDDLDDNVPVWPNDIPHAGRVLLKGGACACKMLQRVASQFVLAHNHSKSSPHKTKKFRFSERQAASAMSGRESSRYASPILGLQCCTAVQQHVKRPCLIATWENFSAFRTSPHWCHAARPHQKVDALSRVCEQASWRNLGTWH